jgi:alpha-glucosidase (family GH31 glycosyl hydrolase)
LRYSLLKQFYSTILKQNGMGAFWKPLFWAFPQDDNLYSDEVTDTQAMIGDALMVAPILKPNTTTR